jgi:hypothetical protein
MLFKEQESNMCLRNGLIIKFHLHITYHSKTFLCQPLDILQMSKCGFTGTNLLMVEEAESN